LLWKHLPWEEVLNKLASFSGKMQHHSLKLKLGLMISGIYT
jgi:hypothetical protein